MAQSVTAWDGNLPIEIVERVLLHLVREQRSPDGTYGIPLPSSDPASDRKAWPIGSRAALDLLTIRSTSRILRSLADDNGLWKHSYLSRWDKAYERPGNEGDRVPSSQWDWRGHYAYRHVLDRQTVQSLDQLSGQHTGRLDCFSAVLERSGQTDATSDILGRELHYHTVQLATWREERAAKAMQPSTLSLAFWSQTAIGALTRNNVAHRFGLAEAQGGPDFEEGLRLMSTFRGSMTHRQSEAFVMRELERIANSVRQKLVEQNVNVRDSRALALALWSAIQEEGFGPAMTPDEFRAQSSSFPDTVLRYHKRTLPMSLVWLYSSVGKRLGITVSAINWPGTILALVHSARAGFSSVGELCEYTQPLYINLFDLELATREQLAERLAAMPVNLPAPLHHLHLDPAKPRDLIARTGRNLLDGRPAMPDAPEWTTQDQILATYAAAVALVACQAGGRGFALSPQFAVLLLNEFPLDLSLIKRVSSTYQSAGGGDNRSLQSIFMRVEAEDAVQRLPELIPADKHRVGHVFRHRKFHYYAVVVGWDERCLMDPDWQRQNRISSLDRGADQPFMNAIRSDNFTPYYVADENVEEELDEEERLAAVLDLTASPKLGSYFDDYDVHTHRFTLGATLRTKYAS